MIAKLLSTTALSLFLVGGAVAQQTGSGEVARDGSPLFTYESEGTMTSETGYFEADANQVLASGIIGEAVYDSNGDDAESIGEVNDIIIGSDGLAEAVVIGVGGFIGIGEKEVAVDFNRLSWIERDDDRVLVLATTREELESAPEFDRTVLSPADGGDRTASADAPTERSGDAAAVTADDATSTTATTDRATRADTDADATDDTAAATATDRDDEATATAPERTAAIPTPAPNVAEDGDANEGWATVDRAEITADELMGADVHGADNADLGEVSDIILTADGQVEAYVVDVGGFLGMFAKPVALDASSLDIMRNENGELRVITSLNAERLKEHTAYSKEAYDADRDTVLLR